MKLNEEDLIRRIRSDLLDSFDEELEMEVEDRAFTSAESPGVTDESSVARHHYFRELFRLQVNQCLFFLNPLFFGPGSESSRVTSAWTTKSE